MHKHQCHNELKQKKIQFFSEKEAVACDNCQFSSVVNYRNPSAINCRCSHTLALNCRCPHVNVLQKLIAKTPKIAQNKPIKSNTTCFLRQKCVDTS